MDEPRNEGDYQPLPRYEVSEAAAVNFPDIVVKDEQEEYNEYDYDDEEFASKEVKLRFDTGKPATFPVHLKIRNPHVLLLSDTAVTGHFDLVLRRTNYPVVPIGFHNSARNLTTPFEITSVDGVQYGPIKVTEAGGEVIHQGATFFAKNLAYVMIAFRIYSTFLSEKDRSDHLEYGKAKITELLILDHNTGQILDSLEVKIVAEERHPDYYGEGRKAVKRRKREEERETGRQKSAPATTPSTSGLGTSTSGLGTSTSNEDETDEENQMRKQHLVDQVLKLYAERGRELAENDLTCIIKMTQGLLLMK
jgi:hypothetical protein